MSLELVTGKDYLSFSAVKNYANCGEQYRLERIVGIPTAGSWALFGGRYFHRLRVPGSWHAPIHRTSPGGRLAGGGERS